MSDNIIGIVGGVGPYAGFDLMKKIFDLTKADKDQKHLPIILVSFPDKIVDRTDFILNKTKINPAFETAKIILKLEKTGANIIGIPCNTIHSPRIFSLIKSELKKNKSKVLVVNMIDEVCKFISQNLIKIKKIGILSTKGTYLSKVYETYLNNYGFESILPNSKFKDKIHRSIYDSNFGIKANLNYSSAKAKKIILESIRHLKKKGAQVIILGCTEIPLVIKEKRVNNIILVDSTLILAYSLIRKSFPQKLKSLEF